MPITEHHPRARVEKNLAALPRRRTGNIGWIAANAAISLPDMQVFRVHHACSQACARRADVGARIRVHHPIVMPLS